GGVACPAGSGCAAGSCACLAGRGDCDGNPANGCEADLTTDANNCGVCGASCFGAACNAGTCCYSCAGFGGGCGIFADGCGGTFDCACALTQEVEVFIDCDVGTVEGVLGRDGVADRVCTWDGTSTTVTVAVAVRNWGVGVMPGGYTI